VKDAAAVAAAAGTGRWGAGVGGVRLDLAGRRLAMMDGDAGDGDTTA
jgi:hypothetical protein